MNTNKIFDYGDALLSLYPNCAWSIVGTDYSTLEWKDKTIPAPAEEVLKSEIIKLKEDFKSIEYRQLRKNEYPDIFEYIDGIVKGDQSQINNYISMCRDIKKKYPKPK